MNECDCIVIWVGKEGPFPAAGAQAALQWAVRGDRAEGQAGLRRTPGEGTSCLQPQGRGLERSECVHACVRDAEVKPAPPELSPSSAQGHIESPQVWNGARGSPGGVTGQHVIHMLSSP